jgi:hypothetical protein
MALRHHSARVARDHLRSEAPLVDVRVEREVLRPQLPDDLPMVICGIDLDYRQPGLRSVLSAKDRSVIAREVDELLFERARNPLYIGLVERLAE